MLENPLAGSRSPLTLVPARGGNCRTLSLKDIVSVPGVFMLPTRVRHNRFVLFDIIRLRDPRHGTGICWWIIHELYYFARGRNKVGGANLPILDYLVMEKCEGQTNTLSGGILVNRCNRND